MSKKITIFFFFAISVMKGYGQTPSGIQYQAVLRDNLGQAMANALVNLVFKIHDTSPNGDIVYQEQQSLTSNYQGLVSCTLGMGTAEVGTFDEIDWSSGIKFLQVQMGEIDLGTQQMMSVPYSIFSKKSQNSSVADNGISHVSIAGDTLYMSNGNFIIIPGLSAANYTPSVLGCMDLTACNYSASATVNGNCIFMNDVCDDGLSNTVNDLINQDCVCQGTIDNTAIYAMGNGVTDIDGNFYTSIVINGQEWMQQNLKVTRFKNGDLISTNLDNATWQNTTSAAYAIYDNLSANNAIYGKLYNAYAVNDSRGICPAGWHMPSDLEWTYLIDFLDPTENPEANGQQSGIAGGMMKALNYWNSPNGGASNSSGFSAVGAGYRSMLGTYVSLGDLAYWWSSNSTGVQTVRIIPYQWPSLNRGYANPHWGYSIRCMKD